MSPKTPESEGQGSFFTEEVVGNGSPDPMDYDTSVQLTPNPEGVFEKSETIDSREFSVPQITEAARKAAATRHRRESQLGKHSPLQRDGTYLTVRAGDVLPGFGIVTRRNLADAESHAAKLENERKGNN